MDNWPEGYEQYDAFVYQRGYPAVFVKDEENFRDFAFDFHLDPIKPKGYLGIGFDYVESAMWCLNDFYRWFPNATIKNYLLGTKNEE
jgi:hypothetical protein